MLLVVVIGKKLPMRIVFVHVLARLATQVGGWVGGWVARWHLMIAVRDLPWKGK
jgi:hypothetical protein